MDSLRDRGMLLDSIRCHEDAVYDIQRAVRIEDQDAELWNCLAHCLHNNWRLNSALIACDKALEIDPNNVRALLNRAGILGSLHRYVEAMAVYEKVLSLDPKNKTSGANRIFMADLMSFDFEAHQQLRRDYYQQFLADVEPKTDHVNNRDPDRPLVIGYVSADFRDHSMTFSIRHLLCDYDRDKFQVICYAGNVLEDEITNEFKSYVDKWRRTNKLRDEELVWQIDHDGVDILVDLSGCSAGNRLRAFAHKPAPIQVTAWGYSNGVGCPFIDYLFSDMRIIPEDVRPLFAETIVDLPGHSFYAPRDDIPPISEELPSERNGFVTFSCFNRDAKISDEALALFGRVLEAVPGSIIKFKDVAYQCPELRMRAASGLGVDPARAIFLDKQDYVAHMNSFADVDIALDPFPHNGGISSWEPLFMGVPVICKRGSSHPSRLSAAIMDSLVLDSWVAGNDEGYVAVAKWAVDNAQARRDFRRGARKLLSGSKAGNPELYVREVEKEYRNMWQRWASS